MTAADPSLRRLSYPLKPRPFSEPSDFYLLPLSAISTSGTGSIQYARAHLRRFEPTTRAGVAQSVGAILPIGFSYHLLIGPLPRSSGVFGVYCILANTVTQVVVAPAHHPEVGGIGGPHLVGTGGLPRLVLSPQRLFTYVSTSIICSWLSRSPNAGMALLTPG